MKVNESDNSTTSTTSEAPPSSALAAAMIGGTPATAKVWLDIMTESARFVAERLKEDLETQKAVLHCKSPAELVQLQAEFVRKALEQYSGEAQKLFEIMTDAAGETVKDVRSKYSRSYDDLPL